MTTTDFKKTLFNGERKKERHTRVDCTHKFLGSGIYVKVLSRIAKLTEGQTSGVRQLQALGVDAHCFAVIVSDSGPVFCWLEVTT